jgi:adenylyl cyclase-associated protein
MKESAQFYANRVIKEYKDKDKSHVDWTQSYTTLLTDLYGYVKSHHTTGLAWNPKGGDVSAGTISS